jgi:non-specific serine/threonine protein kinase
MRRVAVDDASPSFGELLRDHRRAAGLTQEELAERAGISPRSISEMERGGAHVPRRDTVSLLARALGLEGEQRLAFEDLIERRRRARVADAGGPPVGRQAPAALVAGPPGRHNLARSLTSFVGREHEIAELGPMLQRAPLLTLVGPGGVGKTRLAQELVREMVDQFGDGTWLVELAGLRDPSLVPGTIAAALGLREFQARDTFHTLAEYLRPRQLLLVLDNCEHLVDACAHVIGNLLRLCPELRVLATSREPLAISGEVIHRVSPLELPPAVRLFVERARAVDSSFSATSQNAAAIERICVGVDGIPLALELAAARIRMLSVEQLAERLERDTRVLEATNRVGLPQHQAIRATIDWSHDLLTAEEQILLRRLAVFAGGWTLELAENVCAGAGIEPGEVLNLLGHLVDRSMVQVDARGAVARYRLLEPIRQYALERLQGADELESYRARHAGALLDLARTSPGEPAGPDEIASLDRFELEHDNLRAALQWAVAHDQSEAALGAAAALFRFWERRGHFREGCAWLEQALALAGAETVPTLSRARALNALAFLYWRGGDPERASGIADQALQAARAEGTARDLAHALLNSGMTAYLRHAHELAVERLEDSVRYAREVGYAPLLSLALTFLGRTRLWVGGPHDEQAMADLEESVALAEAAQSRYAAGHALATLGDLLWAQGQVERAIPIWRKAMQVEAELADRRGIAGCLERLAWVLAASGRLEPAAWLFGAADAQHKLLGVALRHGNEVDHAHFVGVTRRHLGDAFGAAWTAGQAASLDEAVRRALDGTRRLPSLALSFGRNAALDRDEYEVADGVCIPQPRLARGHQQRLR